MADLVGALRVSESFTEEPAGEPGRLRGLGLPEPPPEPIIDTTDPIVTLLSPPDGSEISPGTPIIFTVTDETGLFNVSIRAAFPDGQVEAVFDGAKFRPFYAQKSTRVSITDGFRFTVIRSAGGGWPATPTIEVDPIDSSGNRSS